MRRVVIGWCNATEEFADGLARFTDRHAWKLLLLTVWLVLIVASFSGCLPATRLVEGRLTHIERDPRYEDICTVALRLRDPNQCDMPPVCCSHWVTLTDSTGHRETFFAQWPTWAPGLWVGEEIRGTLRRATVHGVCVIYGCLNQTTTLALWADSDFVILAR